MLMSLSDLFFAYFTYFFSVTCTMPKGWHSGNLLYNLLFLRKKVSEGAKKVSETRQLTFLQLLDTLFIILKKVSKVSKVSNYIYIYI